MKEAYDPERYWSDRLAGEFSLRGTGHQRFDVTYNDWLYRQKARALSQAMFGMSGGCALDVGSGVGWVVGQLRERGFDVVGCDIAQVAVERLAERFPDATFHRAAIGEDALPGDDASMDLVTMLDVSYHVVDNGLWESGLAEIARVLRPGGRLIITDGLGESARTPAPHVRFRSRVEWEAAASRAGLRLESSGPLFRWLSRSADQRGWSRLPDNARGAIEYALERVAPREPHMRWAAFEKRP